VGEVRIRQPRCAQNSIDEIGSREIDAEDGVSA
jgi:hypothetical protein